MLERIKAHPVGFWFVFWGELAERASYYGMKGLLTLFLVSAYAYSEGQAASLTQYFGAACYLMPLAGGILADYFGLVSAMWIPIAAQIVIAVFIFMIAETAPRLIERRAAMPAVAA